VSANRRATSLVDYSIRSVERALDLLEQIGRTPDVTITDLSRAMKLDKSTVARQLACLERRNVVFRDPIRGRFSLGMKLLELGSIVADHSGVREIAYPYMVLLRDRVNETIGLYVRAGPGRACVAQVESHQELRRTLPIGEARELYPGSPGKAFMAFMPPAQVEPIIEQAAGVRFAHGGPADPGELRGELERIRAQGFAFSAQEQVVGGASLSVPLRDYSGSVAAVLAVSGPSSRMQGGHLTYVVEQALDTGAQISRVLGARLRPVEPPSTTRGAG
jgi:DNA-binding IclR family transcriptional regulator